MKTLKKAVVIDGKHVAQPMLKALKAASSKLKKKGIIPHLAVILVGNNQGSLSYIAQKEKSAKKAGVKLTLFHFERTPSYQTLAEKIRSLAIDPSVHGIIVQKPLPPTLSSSALNKCIPLVKDVDGFREKSPYLPPIGLSMFKIFNEIYYRHILHRKTPQDEFNKPLLKWLKSQTIVLLGRGETGGQPIAQALHAHQLPVIIIHSQTEHPQEYLTQADIVISTVGKPALLNAMLIKENAILIGVGITRTPEGIKGDFDAGEISSKAGFYTPTPGGVGPINTACLIENVIKAAELSGKTRATSAKRS